MNIKDGYYWFTRLPSGGFGVFWYHPDARDVHRLVATFQSEDRAETYAAAENGCLAAPEHGEEFEYQQEITVPAPPRSQAADLLIPPSKRAALLGTRDNDLAERMTGDLPALFQAFPSGFTASDVIDKYKVPYAMATETLRVLDRIGLGRYVYRNGRGGPKIFVPPNSEFAESELTVRQSKVFEASRHLADRYGLVSASSKQISKVAEIAEGSVSAILYALEKKGYLMLAQPGGPHRAAVYQIVDHKEAEPV